MKSAGKARSNGLYRHIRTSKEIIRNLLNYYGNISEEEIQKYIDQLKTLGYAEEASASESVSTGVLLRKDETWISIAYSEGGFGIRISVEKS